ncbi:hypothetical protein ABFP60_20585 [Clostridioides difficile]
MRREQIERKYNVKLEKILVGKGIRINHKWYWKCTYNGIEIITHKKTLKEVADALGNNLQLDLFPPKREN